MDPIVFSIVVPVEPLFGLIPFLVIVGAVWLLRKRKAPYKIGGKRIK